MNLMVTTNQKPITDTQKTKKKGIQTHYYKINKSWGSNVQLREYSQ